MGSAGSSGSSSDNEMEKLLEKSKKLPKWVKEKIQKNYNGNLSGDGYDYLDFDGL